jgi:hypothetical protein
MRSLIAHISSIYNQLDIWRNIKQEKLASSQGLRISGNKRNYGCEIPRAEDADNGVRISKF